MEEIIGYFSMIPSLPRSLLLGGGITIFWLIEKAFPLLKWIKGNDIMRESIFFSH